jgi:hypothetical protein
LFCELDLRFDIISKPCISAICKKVETRLSENMGGFRQVPTVYRMTGREVSSSPSPMMEVVLKPFAQVSQNPTFAGLSYGLRLRVF